MQDYMYMCVCGCVYVYVKCTEFLINNERQLKSFIVLYANQNYLFYADIIKIFFYIIKII